MAIVFNVFRLSCVACSFETTEEGEFTDVLDIAHAHEEEREGDHREHFVNCEATERSLSSATADRPE